MWNNNAFEWSVDTAWLVEQPTDRPTVVVAHQPPAAGAVSASDETAWREWREQHTRLVSAHAHLHTAKFWYEAPATAIIATGRVQSGEYALIEATAESARFWQCDVVCQDVGAL